ncbi:MAG: hypothetical protein AAB511_01340 [Patescibacteria group bacterium]
MKGRLKKQIIITLIYLVIFLTFFWFIFSWWSARSIPRESCSDGIRNQNEEDVDCGGICRNACVPVAKYELSTSSAGFVEAGAANKYDLYGEVINPNNDFGSNEFQYSFKLKDSSGNLMAVKSGTAFILPGEKKYILENNVESATAPASVELEVKDPNWIEFVGYEKPQLKIVNKNYTEISSGVGFGEAIGLLKNESPFDFSLIKIEIILKNAENNIVALNSTEIRTVKSGENREFRALWPNKFSGTVGNMEVQAEVNVFDSDSFAKRYFRTQKFQEYQAK